MIVTASKRPQKLQEVPISIYAMTGEQMQHSGITNMEDMSQSVAGLEVIGGGAGNVRFAVRGVTTMAGSIETTSAVGYYLDEVPFSSVSSQMPEVGMWDVARVEVLRGPQGTLFGEGSMGGTLRIITNKPDSNEFSSRIGGEVSSTEMGGMNYSIKGMLNIPVIEDKLALRMVASHSDPEGWIDVPDLNKKNVNENTVTVGRIAALWTPSDKLDVDASFLYNSQEIVHRYGETSRGVFRPSDLNPAAFAVDQPETNDIDYYVTNLTLTYDFGFASLVSATSYFNYEDTGVATDQTPILPFQFPGLGGGTASQYGGFTVKLWSQELRLVSNGDERFDWTVGGLYKSSYRDWNNHFDYSLNNVALPFPPFSIPLAEANGLIYSEIDVTAYALFADLDFELTDTLSIGSGMRYYADDQENMSQVVSPAPFAGFNAGPAYSIDGDDSAFTPKFTMKWKATDGILVFATAASGFRSGGTNLTAKQFTAYPDIPTTYSPEKIWSYEAGIKTSLWQGFTLNAYFYYNDWTDMHLTFYTDDGIVPFTNNAGTASSLGGEIEIFAVLPVDGLSMSFSGSYTDAKIEEDVIQTVTHPFFGPMQRVLAEKDNVIPYTPEWKFSVATQYAKQLTDSLFGTMQVSYSYRSETYSNAENTEARKNDSYNQVNATIGIESESWNVQLFADNLFDSDDTTFKRQANQLAPELVYNTYVRPRTFGLRFNVSF